MLLMVTKGHTSSYAIWMAMTEEAKKKSNPTKVIAYKNINQRALNLLTHGYFEEIKFDLINMHGRRDYKLTLKGMKQLVPHLKIHPDNFKNFIEYMDKIKFRKELFVNVLVNEFSQLSLERKSIASMLNLYQKYLPTEDFGIEWDSSGEPTKIYHRAKAKKK